MTVVNGFFFLNSGIPDSAIRHLCMHFDKIFKLSFELVFNISGSARLASYLRTVSGSTFRVAITNF